MSTEIHYAEIERDLKRRQRSHALLATILAVAAGLGIFAFKWAMKKSYRDDMAEMNRKSDAEQLADYVYVADDPYVSQMREYAGEMCACKDKACAWNLHALASRWTRDTAKPTDERLLEAARDEFDRFADCYRALVPD